MKVTIHVPAARATLGALSEGLTALNYQLMRRRSFPPLYSEAAGVRYQREPPGRERWRTCDEVFASRTGDCEDLAACRAAELRLQGEPARVVIVRSGPRRFHAIVRRADGGYEDPSRILAKGRRVL